MRTPVHRELDAWGPIVERLAVVAYARTVGRLTEREADELQRLYLWVWQHTPVN